MTTLPTNPLARPFSPEQEAFVGNQAGERVFLFLKTMISTATIRLSPNRAAPSRTRPVPYQQPQFLQVQGLQRQPPVLQVQAGLAFPVKARSFDRAAVTS